MKYYNSIDNKLRRFLLLILPLFLLSCTGGEDKSDDSTIHTPVYISVEQFSGNTMVIRVIICHVSDFLNLIETYGITTVYRRTEGDSQTILGTEFAFINDGTLIILDGKNYLTLEDMVTGLKMGYEDGNEYYFITKKGKNREYFFSYFIN
jgi:hypothetical protein